MTTNLTQYIPENHRKWIQSAAQVIGIDALLKYYNNVFLMLYNMQKNTDVDIIKICDPKNYSLFMSCVVTAMHELKSLNIATYQLDNNATIIHRW